MNERTLSNDALPVVVEGKEAPQGLEPISYTHQGDPFVVDDEC